jgi:hypothetical protein
VIKSVSVIPSKASLIDFLNALAVRGANLRNVFFTFDHIFSMGFKSGEYDGRKIALAPLDSIASLILACK